MEKSLKKEKRQKISNYKPVTFVTFCYGRAIFYFHFLVKVIERAGQRYAVPYIYLLHMLLMLQNVTKVPYNPTSLHNFLSFLPSLSFFSENKKG